MGFYRPQFVNVIGSGFAGIECALFLAGHGIKVHLFSVEKENNQNFIEFVKKNKEIPSKKRQIFEKVLLRELNMLGSPLVKYALNENLLIEDENYNQIIKFGKEMIENNENINIFPISISEINPTEITVIATGNHTSEKLMDFLIDKLGYMNCFKKIGVFPIFSNVNESKLFKDRDDENKFYIPLSYEKYIRFINIIKHYSDEQNTDFVFEENTIEWLVSKGKDDLRNFAMRQIFIEGLDEKPYAVLRIKKIENGYRLDNIYSKLSQEAQEDIFRSLEALKYSTLVRKGDVANSCLLNSKFIINEFGQSVVNKNLFFAGSILGIDGALDNIATGLATGININKIFNDFQIEPLPQGTCIGAISKGLTSTKEIKPHLFFEDYDFLKNVNIDDENIINKLFADSAVNLEKFKEKYKHGKRI